MIKRLAEQLGYSHVVVNTMQLNSLDPDRQRHHHLKQLITEQCHQAQLLL